MAQWYLDIVFEKYLGITKYSTVYKLVEKESNSHIRLILQGK